MSPAETSASPAVPYPLSVTPASSFIDENVKTPSLVACAGMATTTKPMPS